MRVMSITARTIRKWRNKGWSTEEILEYFGLTKLHDKGTRDDQWNLNTVANIIGELCQESKTDLRNYQRPQHFEREALKGRQRTSPRWDGSVGQPTTVSKRHNKTR
jgi:hypothetical protein